MSDKPQREYYKEDYRIAFREIPKETKFCDNLPIRENYQFKPLKVLSSYTILKGRNGEIY